MIEKIYFKDTVFAIIIRTSFKREDEILFFTNDEDSQQLGYMSRKKGYIIPPHRHNLVKREVHLTQEVLFIKGGLVRTDFFDNDQNYLFSVKLFKGDVILLSEGGHGFQMLEDSEIVEVKQGPYCGEVDKVRFSAINENEVKYY